MIEKNPKIENILIKAIQEAHNPTMQDRLNRNDTSDTDIIFDVYKGGGQFP